MTSNSEFTILTRNAPGSAWIRRYCFETADGIWWAVRQMATQFGPDGEVVALRGYIEGKDADTGFVGPLPKETDAKVVIRIAGGVMASGRDYWLHGINGRSCQVYESKAYKAGDPALGPMWRYDLLTMPDGTFGLFDGLTGDRVSAILYDAPSEKEVAKFGDAEYARKNEPAKPRKAGHF
jgi:hypothetical protein